MSSRRRNLLDQLLVNSDSCLCIVDARRRMRFFSRGMEAWTGWSAGDIEGLSCDGLPAEKATPADLLAAAFNPSTAIWKGQVQLWQAVLPTASGGVVRSRFCSIPLSSESGQVERVLMVRSEETNASEIRPDLLIGQQLHAEVAALRADFRTRYNWDSFIGADASLRRVRQLASLLKDSDCFFCIAGNSGTGRRHLAQCIHVGGRASETSFVPIYCDLLSTQALYDALQQLQTMAGEHASAHERPGLLLLVDVDRLHREVQQWLLNCTGICDSVRLAATTSVPLQQVVADGWMLAEFQQMITPVEIELPPLHCRGNDVLLLAHEFVQQNRRLNRTAAVELAPDVASQLLSYHWPGNVRELRQVIHDACQSCSGRQVRTEDLSFAFRAGMEAQRTTPGNSEPCQSLDELLRTAERRIVEGTLTACGGNKAEAARRLGLTRPSFYRRLKTLGLRRDGRSPGKENDDA